MKTPEIQCNDCVKEDVCSLRGVYERAHGEAMRIEMLTEFEAFIKCAHYKHDHHKRRETTCCRCKHYVSEGKQGKCLKKCGAYEDGVKTSPGCSNKTCFEPREGDTGE